MRGISWVAEDILASQEGLCSMELVSMLLTAMKREHAYWKSDANGKIEVGKAQPLEAPRELAEKQRNCRTEEEMAVIVRETAFLAE
jgi:hypothetical protein